VDAAEPQEYAVCDGSSVFNKTLRSLKKPPNTTLTGLPELEAVLNALSSGCKENSLKQ